MTSIDYLVALAEGRVPPPSNLNIRTVQQQQQESMAFRFHFVQYASRRAADWKARGSTETLVDFPTLNARSKFWGDDQRAAFQVVDFNQQIYGGLQTSDPALVALQRSILAPQAYHAGADDTNVSGQLTAAYQVTASVDVFGTYATSFKPIGLNLNGVPTEFLWSRNVLNKNYFELLSAAPGNSGLYVGQPGDPRTVGLTLRMSYRSRP